MAAPRDKDHASKAEFMWLMVELGQLDRVRYREVREHGWQSVAAVKFLLGKSDKAN